MKRASTFVCLVWACRTSCIQSFVFSVCFFVLSAVASAQPAWSRGEQRLPITYEEAMKRAKAALTAEGYGIVNEGGAFVTGYKGIHTAIIMCNVAPDAHTWINIVVASTSNDGNVPGAERVQLQKRMDQAYVSGALTGEWILKCCGDELQWVLTIKDHNGNDFSGSFSDAAGGGNVAGVVKGNTIEFTRSGSWGKQYWTGQLVNDGGVQRMINGVWTGDYLDRYPGRNNWHAERKR